MRSVVLLLVGVAVVVAFPAQEGGPSGPTAEVLDKLLQASPHENDVVPRDKDSQLLSLPAVHDPFPSTTTSSPPVPAIQLSTPAGKEEKTVEDNPKQTKDSEEQENQEQPYENSENMMKPLAVEPEAEMIPMVHVLEPIPVEPEGEEMPRIDTFMYTAADAEPQTDDEEPVVDYLPVDFEEGPLSFEPEEEEEVDDTYETEYFPYSVQPVIVELPPASDGGDLPVDDPPEFEGADELPIDEVVSKEGSYETPADEDDDMLFSPERHPSFELGEMDLPIGPDVEPLEPLPEDEGYGDETYLEEPDEEGGIYYYTFPQGPGIPEDTGVVEEVFEPLESQTEEGEESDEDIPTGFFSWVLPEFFIDEESSEPIPSDLQNPTDDEDATEYEAEEQFSPDVAEDEIVEGETSDEEVGPAEQIPFIIDHEVDPDEDFVEEIPDFEELPYEEMPKADVYFPAHDDTFLLDNPSEDYYPLDEEMYKDEYEGIYGTYDYEEDEGNPMNRYFSLVETFPELDNQSPEEDILFVDEMPREPNPEPFQSIFFPSPVVHKESEEEVEEEDSSDENPQLHDIIPVGDEDISVMDDQPPPSLQILSQLEPIVSITSDPMIVPKPLENIPFPFWNVKKGQEPSDSPLYDMLNILVLGAAQKDSMDKQVPGTPIAVEPFTPQGRPLPITEIPQQDFHRMEQPPRWIPDITANSNNNNHKTPFSSFMSDPYNPPMLSDQFSNKMDQSSSQEPHEWTHQQSPSRDIVVNTMGSPFPVQTNMHHHHPPTFMDSSTTFMTDASHRNRWNSGMKFSDGYQPPITFRNTHEATPSPSNMNWLSSLKPSYLEVFGLPYHNDPFSSPQSHYGPGRFPHHSPEPMWKSATGSPRLLKTSPSDFIVFQPQYQPQEGIYLRGPQNFMKRGPFFYHSNGRNSLRPSPLSIFSQAWSPPGDDKFPMEVTFFPDREPNYNYPISRPRRSHISFSPFQSFSRDGFSHTPYYGVLQYPQQRYPESTFYPELPPSVRYPRGYP